MGSLLKNLRAGIAELESKITTYEIINGDNRGFDRAKFSTFRESKEGRLQRAEAQPVLFTDPRTGTAISSTYDANIDLVGERLTLALQNTKFSTQ